MSSLSLLWWLLLLGLILLLVPQFSLPAAAQNTPRITLPSFPSLRQLTRTSGYIFTGAVTAVGPLTPATAGGVGTIGITFHVERGIRGVRSGETLTIREWVGLWDSGERYRVGERVLLCLYPPSQLGLTSPVGGPLGRFPVDPEGRILLEPGRVAALMPGPRVDRELRGKSRITPDDFAHIIQRAAEE